MPEAVIKIIHFGSEPYIDSTSQKEQQAKSNKCLRC